MGSPIGKSGDMFVYVDSSGKRVVKPVVGLLLNQHTANGSPVLTSGSTVRLSDGSTVVLGADLGSRFSVNGNPVKDLHTRSGSLNGDLSGKYGVRG
jgi:hypothetical protein